MTPEETQTLIAALKSGKVYVKPLPYTDVEGGTIIIYDPERSIFIESFLNRSLFERGEEDFSTEREEYQLITMLVLETYTDARYPIPTKSNYYQIVDPPAPMLPLSAKALGLAAVNPFDYGKLRCPSCRGYRLLPVDTGLAGQDPSHICMRCALCGREGLIKHR